MRRAAVLEQKFDRYQKRYKHLDNGMWLIADQTRRGVEVREQWVTPTLHR